MEYIVFKKDAFFNDNFYVKNEKLSINDIKNLKDIWKLNEKGFIEPITYKEYLQILNNKKSSFKTKIEEE